MCLVNSFPGWMSYADHSIVDIGPRCNPCSAQHSALRISIMGVKIDQIRSCRSIQRWQPAAIFGQTSLSYGNKQAHKGESSGPGE